MTQSLPFSETAFFGEVVDSHVLRSELEDAGITVERMNWNDPGTVLTIDVADGDSPAVVAGVVASHDAVRPRRYREIDAHTVEVIERGFEFPALSGNFFPLGPADQTLWLYLREFAASLVYPYLVSQLDNDGAAFSVADAATMAAFTAAAFDAINAGVTSGVALKESIRTAPDFASVVAIVDTR